MATLQKLFVEAEGLGREPPFWPIDIMRLATQIAGHKNHREAVVRLKAFLDDESAFLRHLGLRALRLIEGAQVDAATILRTTALLASDEAPNVRAEAARLLMDARRASAPVLEALAKAASDDDTDYVRNQADEALQALR
jgi:HEAT repeats